MSTALSFKSESGDYYTYLTSELNVNEIVRDIKQRYDEEFPFLEVVSSDSDEFNTSDLSVLEDMLYEAMEEK